MNDTKIYLISIEEGYDYPKLENRVDKEMDLLRKFGPVYILSFDHDSRSIDYRLVMHEGNKKEGILKKQLGKYFKKEDGLEKLVISEIMTFYEISRR